MNTNFIHDNPTVMETGEAALARLKLEAQAASERVREAEAQEREQERQREERERHRQAQESQRLFHDLLAETTKERARFQAYYREAAISLGKIAHSAQLLTQLSNGVARILPDPEITAAMKTASLPPAPLEALEAEGYKPTTGAGWNWKIAVPPMRPKGGIHE